MTSASETGARGAADRLRTAWADLGPGDRRSLVGMTSLVVALHVVGFGALVTLIAPGHYGIGNGAEFTVGVGLLAYTFGLRHAFDADHIAAIDNTTRKLLSDREAVVAAGDRNPRRPLSVGFWFSLGHSTVVFGLSALLALGVRSLVGPVEDENSTMQTVLGLIGTSVSGVFLWILGIINLVVLVGIIRMFRDMRSGRYDEAELEDRLNRRGLMSRLLRGVNGSVRKPWHIYPIGVLFGLGFDTATEVGLLVLAGGMAAFTLPFYCILVLPVLFAAGMSLLDTIDGVFMNAAYGWALAKPVRKVYYNITITSLSVAVALAIGTVELLGVLAERTHVESGPLGWVAGIDLDYAGFVIVGLFVVVWVAALLIWRYGKIEERWTSR